MAKVRDVRKALKASDPDSHIAIWFVTKREMEREMEVSMTDEVWRLATTKWLKANYATLTESIKQMAWDAEYDTEGEEVHAVSVDASVDPSEDEKNGASAVSPKIQKPKKVK